MQLRESAAAAQDAGLRYVSDASPGVTRRRRGRGFSYHLHTGGPLKDSKQLARIRALAIPPAWTRVWICPIANGHLQATGFDARGRKQYRYHPDWTAARNECKFEGMAAFGAALPGIRRRIARDLARPGLPREKVIACVVRLLDQALIRVGNDEYARDNNSFGLTTIRNRHVRVNGSEIRFRFKGKSGRDVEMRINDPKAAKIVRRCQELPGQELFEYLDESGESRDVGSTHVNEYLLEITGSRFSAKDFRTWGGTVAAAEALVKCGPPTKDDGGAPLSKREMTKRCAGAVKEAAVLLGNTVATCRKFYVHPRLADAYADGSLARAFEAARRKRSPPGLSTTERAVLRLMQKFDAATRKISRSSRRAG